MGSERLTMIVTSLGLGGAQQQVRQLAGRLHRRGWEVDVVTLIDDVGAAARQALPTGIQTSSLGMVRGNPDPRGIMRLVRHLRRRRPGIVHSHMIHANLLARVARPFSPVPVLICTAHSAMEGGRWADAAYRWTDALCDLTTNVSPQAVERFVAVGAAPPQRIRCVPNGLDLDDYPPRADPASRERLMCTLGVPHQRFVWLNAGRHTPAKDLGTLLQAFRILLDDMPDHHLVLAGDGEERASIQELARGLGLAAHVSFLGYRDDVAQLMCSADAFVMSSAWEGLPVVLLEAAACGLAAVATDVGGTSEVVRDEVTGMLVVPNDAHALAQRMLAMATWPVERRLAAGEAARDHVRRTFDLNRVVSLWELVYAELAEARLRRLRWHGRRPS